MKLFKAYLNVTDQIQIREANVEDAALISLLGRITFTETFGYLFRDPEDLQEYYDRTFSVPKIEKSLSKANNVFWIAFSNRLPVGYAKLKLNSPIEFIKDENVCQLQKIYVLRDFLSMKIGHRLQQTLLSRAAKSGSKKIWLSVLIENERAVNFYLKRGFEIIGEHDFSIGKEDFRFKAMAQSLG